jgi:small subunit ribosomal protein S4
MVIAIAQGSRDLEKLKQNVEANAFRQPPQWLEYDRDNLVAKVVGVPQKSDIDLPIEEHLIVELYSK